MASASDQTGIELRNGRMRMVIDPRTGAIRRIEDAATGVVHLDARRNEHHDERLFRLIMPAGLWWSCYADAQDQPKAHCVHHGNMLTIEYPDLMAADGEPTGVSARVEVRPSDAPDEFLLTLHVTNRGRRTVIDAAFPLLGGWHLHDGESRVALGANSFLDPRSLMAAAGNNYARNGRRRGWYYPVFLACPWVDVSGPRGGLAYLNYMTEGRNGRFWMENLAGYGDDLRLMFGWSHFIALRPGESWSSPPMGLAVHDGDWHATAERYRSWFDALHPPDYSRPAIRARIGFQNVFFRGFDGTPIRPLEAIPEVAAAGRRYGVDVLCVWDTLTLGNYARHDPHDLTDYSPEEREVLREGLRHAEREGTRTCALINFRHPNVALHLPDPELVHRIQRRFAGTFRTENWTATHTFGDLWAHHVGPESYVFSPFSKAHRERVLRLSRAYLDLGYSSMFYDQPFEVHPDYGFIEQGCSPDATHAQALALVAEVRKLLLAHDPQSVVIGEECDVHGTPYIDQWMSWSISTPSPELIERVAMLRYSMPHTILSWVVDHEPERAAVAFAMGMQLCLMVHGGEASIAEEPQFAERVGALAALRRKTADRTVMARFKDHDGIEVDGDDGFAAYAYESIQGPTIIVAACGKPAKGEVTVHPETFAAAGRPSEGTIFGIDGSQSTHAGTTCAFTLGENDVAVWTL